MDLDLLRLVLFVIGGCLLFFTFLSQLISLSQCLNPTPTPPKYDSELHKFTEKANKIAQESVQGALERNAGYFDIEILNEYAKAAGNESKCLIMWLDVSDPNTPDEEQKFYYWSRWMNYYDDRTKVMEKKHGLNGDILLRQAIG